MPRQRQAEAYEATQAAIKQIARQHMAEHGTAGISLRAIARALDLTAPALYTYFPSLDDLITALIVDAFASLSAAMEQTATERAAAPLSGQVLAQCAAYRDWALAHPTDFQLIYGNPIPGYKGPVDIIGPWALRPFLPMMQMFLQAQTAGYIATPSADVVPPSIAATVQRWTVEQHIPLSPGLLMLLMQGWSRMHGLVMLELFHHSQPAVGDTAALYAYEMRDYVRLLGLP